MRVMRSKPFHPHRTHRLALQEKQMKRAHGRASATRPEIDRALCNAHSTIERLLYLADNILWLPAFTYFARALLTREACGSGRLRAEIASIPSASILRALF